MPAQNRIIESLKDWSRLLHCRSTKDDTSEIEKCLFAVTSLFEMLQITSFCHVNPNDWPIQSTWFILNGCLKKKLLQVEIILREI